MLPDYRIQKTRRGGKKIILLILFLLVVIGAGFAAYAYAKIHRPGTSVSAPVTFSVPKGASTRQVGSKMKEKDLISSTYIFMAYSIFSGASGKIQAGDYQLDKNMSMAKMLDVLSSGQVTRDDKKVVIVEGRTNKQVMATIDDSGLATEEQFEAALNDDYDFKFSVPAKDFYYEGFLFPDTYQFSANLDAHDIVQRILNNFETKITDQMLADMQKKKLSMADVIIMASIIEREVGRSPTVKITDEVRETMQRERENVASVFYNRLEIGMALQSDATVNYATGKSDRRAQLDDLDTDSPYNTYANKGLPPGPISNPGVDSIRAAIYPTDTSYLYFLSNQEGIAYFGRTLEEHNSNRARYLD
jgi:UPF0755 protein